jgi:hypothetical protein
MTSYAKTKFSCLGTKETIMTNNIQFDKRDDQVASATAQPYVRTEETTISTGIAREDNSPTITPQPVAGQKSSSMNVGQQSSSMNVGQQSSGMNPGLSRALMGGLIGATLGTLAGLLAGRRTSEGVKHAAKV